MTSKRAVNLGTRAISKWGAIAQLDIAQEEACELAVAISHHRRGRDSGQECLEEAADVYITAIQVGLIFGEADFWDMVRRKLDRLEGRLGE